MKKITFEQFIQTYNFRRTYEDLTYDTKIIRVYLSDKADNWFEFSIYDFDSEKWIKCLNILSSKVLDSEISSFSWDDNNNVFSVFLCETNGE